MSGVLDGGSLTNDQPLSPGWRYWPTSSNSFNELLERLRLIGSRSQWSFRGEPKWFPAGRASLGRYLAADAPNPDAAEAHRLAHFQEMAESQLTEHECRIAKDAYGWMVLAQHHGMPTRLVDWTNSIWVAAYFAARDEGDQDGFIWAFDPGEARKAVLDDTAKRIFRALEAEKVEEYYNRIRNLPESLLMMGLRGGTRRMVAQCAVYSLGCPASLDHRAFIGKACEGAVGTAELIRVPKQAKRLLMQELWAMNIHAASLFPGLDGAGRAIMDSMKYGLVLPMNLELPHEPESP